MDIQVKLIKMFRPSLHEFFDYGRVICGPNDRAVIGCDTYFPKQWLIEDYDFTKEEVDYLYNEVFKEE